MLFRSDNMDLVEELNLPPVKIHCSVLAEDAIKSAINDYRKKQGLEELILKNLIYDYCNRICSKKDKITY